LAQEEYSGTWAEFPNSPSYLDAMQFWKADIKKDQIRAEFLCLLNSLRAVGRFADSCQRWPLSKQRKNPGSERLEVINY